MNAHPTQNESAQANIANFLNESGLEFRRRGLEYEVKVCPFCHPDTSKADNQYKLSINSGSGAFMCHRCETKGGRKDLEKRLGRSLELFGPSSIKTLTPEASPILKEIWGKTVPISELTAEPGRKYLQGRGIKVEELDKRVLRFHPGLHHSETKSKHPALVFRISDNSGGGTGIQRVYLDPNGDKATVTPNKMALGSITGGAIQFDRPADTLHVAEGPETALAIRQSIKEPTWSTVSANGMKNLVVPASVKTVFIWADLDRSKTGEEAAAHLAQRLTSEGKHAVCILPEADIPADQKGIDWLDILTHSGETALEKAKETALKSMALKKPTAGPASEYKVNDKGVFYIRPDGEPKWICSRLDVLAETRSEDGQNWGRLLRFCDGDGREKNVPLPMSMLASDGTEYRQLLLDLGLKLDSTPEARKRLSEYIMNYSATERARSVTRVGWHSGTFVLPGYTAGPQLKERILLQREGAKLEKYKVRGSLDEWKELVGKPCAGNSRLVFSISTAFASALLDPLGEEGGGFHLRGSSSTGKTTALQVAGSVWGGGGIRGFIESWRATSNGLESTAAQHCDTLLVLDELGQMEAKNAGEIAYLLANGCGKRRASANGGLRSKTEWRLLFLSTGEIGLSEHMAQAGTVTRAGQDIRMADIPADAGAGLGLFENLHDSPNADTFSRRLKDATSKVYGSAARAFLETFVQDRDGALDIVREVQHRFGADLDAKRAGGEVTRVARRFGHVAGAGELAIRYGIAPWSPGEALSAAARCFLDWQAARGTYARHDDKQAISRVRNFLQLHGSSRFPLLNDIGNLQGTDHAINRAGFRRESDAGGCEWLILNEVYTLEVCKGFDPKLVSKALNDRGYLKRDKNGRNSVPTKLPGLGTVRVYVIGSEVMTEDNGSEV